jgi:hypothetical protein
LLLQGVALPADRSYRLVERGRGRFTITAASSSSATGSREVIEQSGLAAARPRALLRRPRRCADTIAAALLMDADARQELLEARDPMVRIQRTLIHVSHTLCELEPCSETVNWPSDLA